MVQIRTIQFVYTRLQSDLSSRQNRSQGGFSPGFQFSAASSLLTTSQLSLLENLASRNVSAMERYWSEVSPGIVHPTTWSFLDFAPGIVLIMRSEVLQDRKYLDDLGRWIPLVHGMLIEKNEFRRIQCNPFCLIDSEYDLFIHDVFGLCEQHSQIKDSTWINVEANPVFEPNLDGEWDDESLRCLLDPDYAQLRPIILHGNAGSIDEFLRYFFAKVTASTRMISYFSFTPAARIPENTMFVVGERDYAKITIDTEKRLVLHPTIKAESQKKSTFLTRALKENCNVTFEEYAGLLSFEHCYVRLRDQAIPLDAELTDPKVAERFCDVSTEEVLEQFVLSLKHRFSYKMRISLAAFIHQEFKSPIEFLNAAFLTRDMSSNLGSLLRRWLQSSARSTSDLCSSADFKQMRQLASEISDWELSLSVALASSQPQKSCSEESLNNLDKEAFTRCFETWGFRGINLFFHSKHDATLVSLVPLPAWTDRQLLEIILKYLEGNVDLSDEMLGRLFPRLLVSSSSTKQRLSKASKAIARKFKSLPATN